MWVARLFSHTSSKEMNQQEKNTEELPDSWWHKVYVGVIVTTIVVVLLLWSFTEIFS